MFKLHSSSGPFVSKGCIRTGKDSEETKRTVKAIGWLLIKELM